MRQARSCSRSRGNRYPSARVHIVRTRLARLDGPASLGGPITPRYFFHIHHADSVVDEVGTELPDIDAARAGAASLAHRLLFDDVERFWSTTNWSIEVKDETGSTLLSLQFQQGVAVQ